MRSDAVTSISQNVPSRQRLGAPGRCVRGIAEVVLPCRLLGFDTAEGVWAGGQCVLRGLPGGVVGVEGSAEVGDGEFGDRGDPVGALVGGLDAVVALDAAQEVPLSKTVSRVLGAGARWYGSACQSGPMVVQCWESSLSPATTIAGVVIVVRSVVRRTGTLSAT